MAARTETSPLSATENTPAERARATRAVASRARDAAELRDLLAMLGLTPEDRLAARTDSAA